MEIIELMKERHSVRQYTDKKIEKEKKKMYTSLKQQVLEDYACAILVI